MRQQTRPLKEPAEKGGLVLGWFCYSIASNILTYLHTLPEERR